MNKRFYIVSFQDGWAGSVELYTLPEAEKKAAELRNATRRDVWIYAKNEKLPRGVCQGTNAS